MLGGGPGSHGWVVGWHTKRYRLAESQHPHTWGWHRSRPPHTCSHANEGWLRPSAACALPAAGWGQAGASCLGAPCWPGFTPLTPPRRTLPSSGGAAVCFVQGARVPPAATLPLTPHWTPPFSRAAWRDHRQPHEREFFPGRDGVESCLPPPPLAPAVPGQAAEFLVLEGSL